MSKKDGLQLSLNLEVETKVNSIESEKKRTEDYDEYPRSENIDYSLLNKQLIRENDEIARKYREILSLARDFK